MKFLIHLSYILVSFLAFSCSNSSEPTFGKNMTEYIISVSYGDEIFGDIRIELFNDIAPRHCANFDSLVKIGFYDETVFHRVIPNFVIQGGDPNSRNKAESTWGMGDPSQSTVRAEFSELKHKRGIISAARKGNDIHSATSQFFICLADLPNLDGQYTIFGRVKKGMEIVEKIERVPTKVHNENRPTLPLKRLEMNVKKVENTN